MSLSNKFSIYSVLAILALVIGMFFRTYQPLARLTYNHDADLASWVIKDIMFDGHPRLIGQLTTQPGVFIGSLTYYAQIPGYWIARFDPAGSLLWSWILSFTSLVSIFWVTYKLYGKKAAVVTALMFAASFDISRTERVAVPTALAFVWLSWFYYFLHRLYSGYSKSLYGLALLFALVWHINLALGLLFPLVAIGLVINIKKIELKHVLGSITVGVTSISPLLLFEVKHHFQQTRAILASGHTSFTVDRFIHTLMYAARNMNETYWSRPTNISIWLLPILFVISVLYLTQRKVYSKVWTIILIIWFGLLLGFFTTSSINLSEYYLHGLNIVWIMTFGLVISRFNAKITAIILGILILINLFRLFTQIPNHAGYLERKQLTAFIAQDAKVHNYPCVAVSYITDPGNNLGYRYLFYRLGLHVNLPASNSPVYTIVFPQSLVNHLDYSAGSIGLILPDYNKYNVQEVQTSCTGPDENVTGPMFGFTK